MSEVHDGGLGAASRPSLEEILKGIPPELLDQPCQDKHLCEVACHVTNWLSLAPFLGISEAEEKEILGNWPRNTAKQKIDLFRKWREKRGRKATYRRLSKTVWKAGEVSLAEKVCDVATSLDSSAPESGEDDSCTVEASASSLTVNQQPTPGERTSESMSPHTDTHTPTASGLDKENKIVRLDIVRPIPRPRTRKAIQESSSLPSYPPKPKPRSIRVVCQPSSIRLPPPPLPGDSPSERGGKPPELFHTDQPTPTTNEPDPLDPYIQYLCDMYDIICPQFLVLQWPPPPTRKVFNLTMIQTRNTQHGPVDEEVVRLLQRGYVTQYTNDRVFVQLKDLFTLDQKKRKIILIEGAPGSGKSTLAWNACQQWKVRELFQEFKMVVFVQLRDPRVQLAKSIADLLPAGSEERKRNVAEGIEACEGRRVLFVMDGWDEYEPGLGTDSIVGRLICNPDKLEVPYSSLIITSRPIASAVLQQRASSRVELVGFTPEEVGQYFQEVVQDPVVVSSLQEQLKTLPVVEASCYLPLNAAIVAHLFLGLNYTLPRTLYGVFSALVCGCIIRHLTKKSKKEGDIPEIHSLNKLPHEIQAPFESVCVLAYEASMKNKVTFSSEDLSSYGVSVEGNGLGLMQCVQSFLSGKSDSYHFIHLSVQELLAAVHISKLGPFDQVSVFHKLFSEPRLVDVFHFFAALTKLETEGIRQVVASVIVQSKHVGLNPWTVRGRKWRRGVLKLLHCLYEAQDMSLCLFVASLLGDNFGGLDLFVLSLSPLDCLCVGYFLCCVCVGREGAFALKLRYCGLNNYRIGYLVKELCKCSGVAVSRGHSKAAMGCIGLDLSHNSIDGHGVRLLCELMNNPSVITRLDLSLNKRIQDDEDGLLCLLQVLCRNHSLVEVRLVECNLRINGKTASLFVEMLHKNDSLKVLDLGWNDGLGDVGAGYIAEGMIGNRGVVRLGLELCLIGVEGGKVLGRMLTKNRTLESLSLWRNRKMGDVGLMEVSKGMQVNSRLDELNIGDSGYSLDCLKEFVVNLKENSHLRTLGVRKEEVELLVRERAVVNNLRRQCGKVELEVVDI